MNSSKKKYKYQYTYEQLTSAQQKLDNDVLLIVYWKNLFKTFH